MKIFVALLLAAVMVLSVFGTLSATAQSTNHSALPTTVVRQASFSGRYTGHENIKTTGGSAVTATRGSFSGSATFNFDGNMITAVGSGAGTGEWRGSVKGPYTTVVTISILQSTLHKKVIDGTYSVDVAIPNQGTTHLQGPFHGTFDGTTMKIPWSYKNVQLIEGGTDSTHFNGFIEFVMAQPDQP